MHTDKKWINPFQETKNNNFTKEECCFSKFSVAPMLKRTDRHCRYFFRKLSKKTLLYTEMVVAQALIKNNDNYLDFNEEEHPIALQLGGSDKELLVKCSKLAQERGYDEINLNIGCPSIQAQKNMFGVCLMKNANLVSDCIKAIRDAVTLPVTIKTRIGFDNQNSYEFLYNFIDVVSKNDECKKFIIHAREAYLSNLNPKKNCKIPPLNYSRVYQLKRDFSHLIISINGGIKSLKKVKEHLKYVDGVMIGRAIYQNPKILASVDREIFNTSTFDTNIVSCVYSMYPYIEYELSKGTRLWQITRHMFGLFHNIPGSRQWRQYLSQHANKAGAGTEVLDTALNLVHIKH